MPMTWLVCWLATSLAMRWIAFIALGGMTLVALVNLCGRTRTVTSPIDASAADGLGLTDSAAAVTDDPTIIVNGLAMPTKIFTRVMTALRGLYPTITSGLSDDAAIQAVMRNVVINWVASWESQQTGMDPAEAAQQAASAAQQARLDADAQARTDTAVITPTVTT